ncbi:hypothetical protein GXM_03254 [Nostoc sphaeroides CCNUC1]|uniref:Uncharacterized protein n=1 Tax=Nostoc sphaeroides CCNUC1 TaxID=2653204 RepID=A0A5P8VZE8_9NOSO|nr:hypothetical protein GXM_03254 [Nostoc sphaeroides CCNUC1]
MVGGGIGGTATALALYRAGFEPIRITPNDTTKYLCKSSNGSRVDATQ